MKNIGSGLRIDISTVNFDISGPEVLCRHSEIRKEEWKFEEHQLNENHIAAVAWHTSGSISVSLNLEIRNHVSWSYSYRVRPR